MLAMIRLLNEPLKYLQNKKTLNVKQLWLQLNAHFKFETQRD